MIGDVDDDGEQEVVSALDKDLYVLDGSSGAVEDKFDMTTISPSVPAIGTDGDGNAIIAVPRGGKDQGDINRVYVLSTGHDAVQGGLADVQEGRPAHVVLQHRRPGVAALRLRPRLHRPAVPRLPRPGRRRERPPLLVVPAGERQPDRAVGDPGVHGLERVRPGALAAGAGVRGAHRPVADGLRRVRGPGRSVRAPARRWRTWPTRSSGRPAWSTATATSVAGKSRATFVRDTFRFVQGRNPTSAEQQAGEDALAGGMSRAPGWPLEPRPPRRRSRLEPEVYVAMTYIGMLGRVPDLGGYDFWVGRVRGGSSIRLLISSFQQSSEYATRVT